jgi:hypothetical protein
MGNIKNVCKMLVEKPEGKRCGCRQKDNNNKMDLKDMVLWI